MGYNDFLKKLGNIIDILGAASSIYNQGKSQQDQQDQQEQAQYQSKYADYSGLAQDALTAMDNAISDAEKTKNNAYGDAQQARDVSYADAERLREKSILDANMAYVHSQPTYGANAEALLSRGLTGSGYSDYLAGKAYATQRADIAAARETEAQSRRVADVRYADAISQANQQYANAEAEARANYVDYINGLKGNVISDNAKFEEEARTAYSNLIGLAEQGASEAYINSYIAKYGDYYGWSDTEKKAIKDVVDDYKATYTITDGNTNTTNNNNVSGTTQQSQTVQQVQQQNKNNVISAIQAGDASVMNNLDALVQNGQLSESDLPGIWKAAIVSAVNSASNSTEIQEALNEIDNHNLSDADKAEIRSLADKKKSEIAQIDIIPPIPGFGGGGGGGRH